LLRRPEGSDAERRFMAIKSSLVTTYGEAADQGVRDAIFRKTRAASAIAPSLSAACDTPRA